MAERFDAIVVGGGLVGLATAWHLAHHHGRGIALLEAEAELAQHQSGHNSGVVHSGLYYAPGSRKALLCRAGRRALLDFCAGRGIPVQVCGKLVVATRRAELSRLEELEQRGRANGLALVERLTAEGIREREPHAAGIAGLWVGDTGIVHFPDVAAALAAELRSAGSSIRTAAPLERVGLRDGEVHAVAGGSEIRAAFLINCGGLYADRIARQCGAAPAVQIVPFRGEYFHLREEREDLVRALIYPVPDPRLPFLGVHFTRRLRGGVEAGPNAVLALHRRGYRRGRVSPRDVLELLSFPGFWRMAARHAGNGLVETYRSFSKRAFVRALQRLVPEVRREDLAGSGSGVRAQAVDRRGRLLDDFAFLEHGPTLHVLNAPSPGATACLAIGAHVARRAVDPGAS